MNPTAKYMRLLLAASLAAFATPVLAADSNSIPSGTIFPVLLNSALSSSKAKPGQSVTARIMQNVPLSSGRAIHAGATVIGHITSVTSGSNGRPAQLSVRFDTLKVWHERIPITTNLRAIASFMDVEEAQIPPDGPDRGTPETAYTTIQIGGDAVYRGGGPVVGESGEVGKPVFDGVLVQLNANPERGCPGVVDSQDALAALWVFSSNACGVYGLPDLKIARSGRANPAGEITFESTKGEIKIRSGAGMLLRVNATEAPSGA